MGAGRRTSTYDIDTGAAQLGFVERQRNLGENLGGVIFGCSHDTYDECVQGLIFGLPRPHICYVQYIVPGMPVFLYNYSDRTMHGIYKAVSEGDLEINPRGWTTFPNQRTQYPAQVRVEVYNQSPELPEREFRPILRDCYSQDTSQSSRLCFELKKSEAQNLCRAFNAASARVNLGSSMARTASPATPSSSSRTSAATPAQRDSSKTDEIFPALGTDWQAVGKKRRDAMPDASSSTSNATSWAKAAAPQSKPPSTAPLAPSDPPVAQPPRQPLADTANASSAAGNGAQEQRELQADPNALATGAFDAPTKAKKRQQAKELNQGHAANGHAATAAVAQTKQPDAESSQPGAVGSRPRAVQDLPGAAQDQSRAAVTRPPGPLRPPGPPTAGASQQSAPDPGQLREALQSLPPAVAEALLRHVSYTNEALQKAETERRMMARSLAATQAQLAALPQLQVEQRQMREGAAAMAAELVSLRQHVASLGQPMPNGLPPSRPSSGQPGPPPARPHIQPAPPSQAHQPPSLSQGQFQELYLTGGNDGTRWLDAVEIFSPSRGSWLTGQAMPLERGYGAAAAIQRQLYVMGGGNGSSWLQSVMMCNLQTGDWLEVAPMNAVRGSLAAVALDQKLYAMGGGQPAVNRDTTEVYDAQLNQWLAGPTMNFRRFTTAAGLLNQSIYVSGGYDGQSYLRSVERLDPREGKWTLVADMQQKRGSHASTVAYDQIFTLGGWDANSFLSSVEVYDARKDAWRMIAPMEESRAYGAAVTVDGHVYAVGGMQSDVHNEIVECYDSMSDSWHRLSPPVHILQKRAFLAACVVDVE